MELIKSNETQRKEYKQKCREIITNLGTFLGKDDFKIRELKVYEFENFEFRIEKFFPTARFFKWNPVVIAKIDKNFVIIITDYIERHEAETKSLFEKFEKKYKIKVRMII